MIEDYNQFNTSGQGSSASVPKEIKRWNWGAFFLTWIWGLFHHVWLSLLVFIPYAGLVMMIILGIKGSEWAWQAQHYDSIEEFKKRERKWNIAGIIVWSILILSIVIMSIARVRILDSMMGAEVKVHDARRIVDLHNVQNALELYYAKNGNYPVGTYNSNTSWDTFRTILTGAGIGVNQVPRDPLDNTTYYYRYGGTATDYVLGAQLEQGDAALNDDIDDTINGINCTDPVYCIRP
jgi:hypothetical protein